MRMNDKFGRQFSFRKLPEVVRQDTFYCFSLGRRPASSETSRTAAQAAWTSALRCRLCAYRLMDRVGNLRRFRDTILTPFHPSIDAAGPIRTSCRQRRWTPRRTATHLLGAHARLHGRRLWRYRHEPSLCVPRRLAGGGGTGRRRHARCVLGVLSLILWALILVVTANMCSSCFAPTTRAKAARSSLMALAQRRARVRAASASPCCFSA